VTLRDRDSSRVWIGPGIELRPALTSERALLEDLHAAALGPVALVGYGWPESRLREQFRAEVRHEACLVIERAGHAVGYLALEERRSGWYVEVLAIRRRWQGLGIGEAVMRGVLARAGDRVVWLSVLHVNRAQRLYERLGFREIARDRYRRVMEWRATHTSR
jgi:ribosomal protein S18 acetylase RimI-like enzyme